MKKYRILAIAVVSLCLCSCSQRGTTKEQKSSEFTAPLQSSEAVSEEPRPSLPTDAKEEDILPAGLTATLENFSTCVSCTFIEKKKIEDEMHYYYENVIHFTDVEKFTENLINLGYEAVGAWQMNTEKHFHAKKDTSYIDILLINNNCEIVAGKIDDSLNTAMAYKHFESIDDLLPVSNATLLSEDHTDFPIYRYGEVTEEDFRTYVKNLHTLGLPIMQYKEIIDDAGDYDYQYYLSNKTGYQISIDYYPGTSAMNVYLRNYGAMVMDHWAEDY